MDTDVAVADDGARLWFESEGSGIPFVLCHGGPGLWDNLSELAALVSGSARAIRWEQRGCGRSSRVGPYTLERYLLDLDQLRLHLGYDRWVVGGHSWGASLALRYALARPTQVAGLVYISGVGVGHAWNRAYHAEADRRLTPEQRRRRDELKLMARDHDQEREYRTLCWAPDFADRARALALASIEASARFDTNYECNAALNAATKHWDESALLEQCRSVEVPILILHGAQDPRPSSAVKPLHEAFPRAQLHVVAAAGHLPWIEAPAETAGILNDFLGRVSKHG